MPEMRQIIKIDNPRESMDFLGRVPAPDAKNLTKPILDKSVITKMKTRVSIPAIGENENAL